MSSLTAILLCGGKGERLRPFTDTLPKALVPLNGRPLLYHLMKYLAASGVSRFVVCVGYKAEAIEEFVAGHREPSWEVTCVNSGDASMTKRILDARRHVAGGPALICYGDTLANVDLEALRRDHLSSGALVTLTTYPLHSPFGIVSFDDDGCVQRFEEKPRLPYWINIGFMLCQPEAFGFLSPDSDMPEFLAALSEAGVLFAHRHTGKHLTVNTEKDRALAEAQIVEFYTYSDGQRV
ncbi:MAG TPA: sugar phosphate nucleotidyltransferase [Pyrinomonadaceae bacterium]|jgi:glucose-1-phosphate cytidylyltransferase|nr:sugar phosphate nucleotidyltransferase [Pyrinomonadaceae bacterium]